LAARLTHRLPSFVLAWTLAFLIAPALASAACSGAVTTTYTGGALGDWSNPANWDNGAPVGTDIACVPSGKSVQVTTAASVADIEIEGALQVTGAGGSLAVAGGAGSRLAGTVTVDTGALLDLGSNTSYEAGTLTLNNGTVNVESGTFLTIANGVDVDNPGGGVVNNAGQISITGSTGADHTVIDAVLNNDGIIGNDGPVDVRGGGNGGGSWKLGSGAGVDEPIVTINTVAFSMNGDFTDVDSGGLGHLVIASDLQMTTVGLVDPHIHVYQLDVSGPGSTLDFTPAPGGLPDVVVSSLNIDNPGGLFEVDAYLSAQTVVVNDGALQANADWELGQFHWGGGDITSANGSTVSVRGLDMTQAAGDSEVRSLSGDVRLLMNGQAFPGLPTYSGTVGVASFTLNGTTIFQIAPGVEFSIGADIDILSTGTGYIANEGIIDKQTGAGVGSLIQPLVTTQSGELWVTDSGTSLNLALAPDTFTGGVLTGTLVLDGILSFPGTVTTLNGNFQIGASGQITDGVSGPDAVTTLVGNGAGSTITVQNPMTLSQNFVNQGTIDIQGSGILAVSGGKTYTQQAGGVTRLSAAGSTLTLTGGMAITGGTLQGIGTVDGDVTNSGGTVAPGNSPGTLTINGNFTQNGTGVYMEEIDGPAPGQFDKLQVIGTATLGGTLIIGSTNGYQAPDGQFFQIIDAAGGFVGTWDGVVQTPFVPYFDQIYLANTMVLASNSVSAGDVTQLEGNSGTTDFTFTVSLGAASNAPVSVDWVTQDGSATFGSDYTAANGTVNFAPGETTKTVTVAVSGDTAAEGTENFAINLSNPVNTRIRDGQGVGTITEDDAPQATRSQVPPGDIDGFPIPPPPVQGKAVNVEPLSGTVLVKLPGTTKFIRLPDAEQVPVGTIVDARKGKVRLFSAGKGGRVQFADFYEGMFQVLQKAGQALTDLKLVGGSFAGCPKASRARAAARRKKTSSVRHLWGSGKGQFRTQGRYASATIRGTKWLTDDRCDGTLIRVTVGAVTVRDLTLKKSLVLKKPKSYLAPAGRR
jgi:fibronectin-binding autotransporter adhesin